MQNLTNLGDLFQEITLFVDVLIASIEESEMKRFLSLVSIPCRKDAAKSMERHGNAIRVKGHPP